MLNKQRPRICFGWQPDTTRYGSANALPYTLGLPPSNSEAARSRRDAFDLTSNKGFIVVGEATARLFDCNPHDSALMDLRQLARSSQSAGDIAKVLEENFDVLVLGTAYELRPGVEYSQIVQVLEALHIPIVVFGLSVEDLDLRASDMHESVMAFARLLNDRAALFGVRAESTNTWLERNGMSNGVPLGCPSVHLFPKSLMDMRAPSRAAGEMLFATGGYLLRNQQRTSMLTQLFADNRTSYIVQDEVFELSDDELDKIPFHAARGEFDAPAMANAVRKATGIDLPFSRYFMFDDMNAWRQCLSWHDVYIGDRFHGAITAMQAGIPAVIISKDVRSKELAAFYDLPSLSLELALELGLERIVGEFLAEDVLGRMKQTFHRRSAALADELNRVGLSLNVV